MIFKTNDRVRVNNYSLITNGMYGTIINTYSCSRSCDVRLDNGKTIYYNSSNLIKVAADTEDKENKKMYITGNFKVAKVKFMSGTNTNTEYEYAMFDDCCSVGDVVAVQSARHGIGVAKITAIIDKDRAITKKFEREIIAPINMDAYEQRKKNRARLKELDNKMKKKADEINRLAVFEMLAEKDEELKMMLEEYKSLRENGVN